MKRIRLQVRIMHWQDPGSATTSSQARQDADFTWCQPCNEDLTIQDLADGILHRWGRLCVGKGSLSIKELRTFYGDLLDMEDTVGAIFDDRADFPDKLTSQQVLPTSIVQVYRYPPDPAEVRNIQRYGSLMPESSARPAKRSIADLDRVPQNSQFTIDSIEGVDDGNSQATFVAPNKRQRTYEPHKSNLHDLLRVSQIREQQGESLRSQKVRNEGPIYQVEDSQKSPTGKRPNPYGTPTSPSSVNPQKSSYRTQIYATSIPDSPQRRVTTSARVGNTTFVDLDRERTKSESPEIRLSVHDIQPVGPESPVAQTQHEVNAVDADGTSQSQTIVANSSPPRSSIARKVDRETETGNGDARDDDGGAVNGSESARKGINVVNNILGQARHVNGSRRHSEQIFDEIESDTESFHGKQQMHSTKGLTLDRAAAERSATLRTPLSLTRGQPNGQSLVPNLPLSKQNGRRIPLGELDSQKPLKNPTSERNRRSSSSQRENDGHGSKPPSRLVSVQIVSGEGIRSRTELESRTEDTLSGKFQDSAKTASPAMFSSSETHTAPPKNFRHLDVEHPVKKALSQARKPDTSSLVPPESFEHAQDSSEVAPIHDAERLSDEFEVEEQQQSQASADTQVGERDSFSDTEERREGHRDSEANPVEVQEVSQRSTASSAQVHAPAKTMPVDSEGEVQSGGDKPMVADAKVMKENSESKVPALDVHKALKSLGARPASIQALTKMANAKAGLDEGKKEIESERRQKAERKRKDAERRAQQASAVGTRESSTWADQLFNDAKKGSIQGNNGQVDTTMVESPNQVGQLSKSMSNEVFHRSSSPSGTQPMSRNRKSLTPALPNASILKSPVAKGGLSSSNPVASKSSANSETPLRSALKQNLLSNTLRRSVSFINDQADNHLTPTAITCSNKAPASQPFKSLVELNNELALKAVPSGGSSKKQPRVAMSSKNVNEPSVKKGTSQQKLNVIRDKKLNGRATGSLPLSRSSPKQVSKPSSSKDSSTSETSSDEDQSQRKAEIGLRLKKANKPSSSEGSSTSESSSDEDEGKRDAKAGLSLKKARKSSSGDGSSTSGTSSDQDESKRKGEAGPSSRNKIASSAEPRHKSPVTMDPQIIPMDPAFERMTAQNGAAESSLHVSRSSSAPSRPKSASRSPALVVSEANHTSSSSTTESSSESDSGSDTESSQEFRPSSAKINKDQGQAPSTSTSKRASQTKDEVRQQLEPNPSVPAQPTQSISPVSNKNVQGEVTAVLLKNQNSSNNTHRSGYKYPTLTTLKKRAEAMTPYEKASVLAGSQNSTNRSVGDRETSTSSSDDSTSDSGEEDDVPTTPVASQTTPNSKSGSFPGLNSVMKLYRKSLGQQ